MFHEVVFEQFLESMSDEAVKNTLSDCKMSFFRITEITKKFTNHVDSELLETEILPSESDTN